MDIVLDSTLHLIFHQMLGNTKPNIYIKMFFPSVLHMIHMFFFHLLPIFSIRSMEELLGLSLTGGLPFANGCSTDPGFVMAWPKLRDAERTTVVCEKSAAWPQFLMGNSLENLCSLRKWPQLASNQKHQGCEVWVKWTSEMKQFFRLAICDLVGSPILPCKLCCLYAAGRGFRRSSRCVPVRWALTFLWKYGRIINSAQRISWTLNNPYKEIKQIRIWSILWVPIPKIHVVLGRAPWLLSHHLFQLGGRFPSKNTKPHSWTVQWCGLQNSSGIFLGVVVSHLETTGNKKIISVGSNNRPCCSPWVCPSDPIPLAE